jgi:DNA invertase Pin-like site-specific DNA recombinase
MAMSIGVYMRVSKGNGQDIASQKGDLDKWSAGQTEPIKVYTDAQTGKTMDRPGFNKLMDDVQSGRVKTVVVWRLDRLGRTAKGLTALFEDFTARKVNLISLKDGLDLSTPAGRMMAGVLASVAQYETEVRAERIHAGLEVAKEKGVKLGRPKQVGDGKGKRLKVTGEQEAIVVRLKGEGKGISFIASATGLSRPTIYSILEQGQTIA